MNKRLELVGFLVFILIIVLIVAGHNFERYYIAKNYPLHVFINCDTAKHSCFVADPATADPTFQASPYAKVLINAAHAPSCLEEHDCSNFSCNGIIGACEVMYCSKDSLEDGETCSNTTQ
jgi:hypothetical protein